jgi:methylglutaconyl-CoA hydratase
MSPPVVEIERRGAVAGVWLNRPESHNALSEELVRALTGAFRELAHDPAVRLAVLGGRGPSFCAGVDIAYMKASGQADFAQNLREAESMGDLFAAVAGFPKPVVVRAHGGVFGGGVGLVCAGDLALAAEDARFGLTEVRLGILPALISPYVLRRLGDRNARELMLTGERFDAAQALRVGLVGSVHPTAELDAAVEERVRALLQGAPGAQARIKSLLERWADTRWEQYRSALPRTLAEMRAGEEARDGLSAFLEKRRPRWAPEERTPR